MKKLLNQMKYGDVILLVFLVLLSFLPVIIFSIDQANSEVEHYTAVISSDGETIHEIALVDDNESEDFEFTDGAGHRNVVRREGTRVYMLEADCPDQLCVRQGEISAPGETIVCLPHTFLVEISSDSDSDEIETDTEIDAIT